MAVEKETAEKRAAELEEALNSLRKEREDRRAEEEATKKRAAELEEELNSLRREREDQRVKEEATTQVLASRLRSMAEGLSGKSSRFLSVCWSCSC